METEEIRKSSRNGLVRAIAGGVILTLGLTTARIDCSLNEEGYWRTQSPKYALWATLDSAFMVNGMTLYGCRRRQYLKQEQLLNAPRKFKPLPFGGEK